MGVLKKFGVSGSAGGGGLTEITIDDTGVSGAADGNLLGVNSSNEVTVAEQIVVPDATGTDTAGSDFPVYPPAGTGTGWGGNWVVYHAPHTSTGSTPNTKSIAAIIGVPEENYYPAGMTGGVFVGAGKFGIWPSTFDVGTAYMSVGNQVVAQIRSGWYGGGAFNVAELGFFGQQYTNGSFVPATAFIGLIAPDHIQFGKPDAAAPDAQTQSVQSVAPGTENVAGEDWTRKASRGTGNQDGGSHVFQTAPAGDSGTDQNVLVDSFKVTPDGICTEAPAGSTAAVLKLGNIETGSVSLDTARYVAAEHDGVPVKVLIAAP